MVTLALRINTEDTTPSYEQICRQITEGAVSGRLPVGTKLPTVRGLATDLGVAPGTVAKAYTQLEAAGVVQGRGRTGTFVSAGDSEAGGLAEAAARAFVERTRHLGRDAEELLAIVRAALTNSMN